MADISAPLVVESETDELHDIVIKRAPETGECRCTVCPNCTEQVTGHDQVLAMQARAVQHAMVTGHQVAEHTSTAMVVTARAA